MSPLAATRSPHSAEPATARPEARPRVLAVDDDPCVLRLAEACLGADCDVRVAADPEAALALLAAEHFDLVVTDLVMDRASGLDLIRTARSLAPDLAAIVLTGAAELALAVEAFQSGACDFLVKPIDPERLRRAAERALQAVRAEAERKAARRQAEQARVDRERQASLLAETARALTESEELDAMLQRCAKALLVHLDAAAVRIYTIDAPGTGLVAAASAGLACAGEEPAEGAVLPLATSAIGRIASERWPHFASLERGTPGEPEPAPDPVFGDGERARADGLASFAGYPLGAASRRLGAIAVFARRPFEPALAEALGPVADGVALGLQRHVAQRQLREQQELLFSIVENSPNGVYWTNKSSVLIGCNRNFARAYGFRDPEPLIGRTERQLRAGGGADRGPDPRDRLVLSGMPLLDSEETLERHDGNRVTLLSSRVPLADSRGQVIGILGVATDITERKQAEQERQRLATVVEQTGDGIVIAGIDGAIVYVNPAFERTTGFERADVLGRVARELAAEAGGSGLFHSLAAAIASGAAWRGAFADRRKDGVTIAVEAVISPTRDGAGRVAHFVAVARDVTRERELKTQLAEAQKLEAIGQLAAGVAHEINTPMQYVSDNARWLQGAVVDLRSTQPGTAERAELDAEVDKALSQMIEGIDRVTSIVRAMKDFSHPGVEEMVAVDLARALESTLAVSRNVWKNVADVATEFADDLPPVSCHPAPMNQVFLNLVVNAAHAIEDCARSAPAAVPPAKGTIRVRTRRDGDFAEVRVSDTGSGIPEAIRSRVFDPFFTTKQVGRGTGQGLAIAHAVVVQQHGGQIYFETGTGSGTTFVVRLPLAPRREPQ